METTSLSSLSGNGIYGGTATLTATLTAGGTGVAGEPVAFSFVSGTTVTPVGTATTDADGVATLTGVSLAGLGAGTYTGYVGAASRATRTTRPAAGPATSSSRRLR